MTYRTDESVLQEHLAAMPDDPDDARDPDTILEDVAAPPAYMWVECPTCGGVFTVYSATSRARLMANVPFELTSSAFVDRTGAHYIPYGTPKRDVHCLDCAASWDEMQARHGQFFHPNGPWFRQGDELPRRADR